jgi:Putative adhesin
MATNNTAGSFVKAVMRNAAFAVALCALAATGVIAAADRWSDETEHVSQTLTLESGGNLRVKSFSGRVTITATDGNQVVVEADRHAPRSRLDRIKLDVHAEGARTVVVDANRRDRSWWEFSGNNVVETDLDIKVPRRTNIDVSVFSAPVTIDRVEGTYKLHSFSARMVLNDVIGPVQAHSFSGAIQIREKSFNGAQTIDVQTFSGSIDLHVPEAIRAAVSFNSFSGHLDSEMPLTIQTGNRRSLKGELGGGGSAELRFKTFSGSVRIDR